jgi:predicted nuclease of predicted toxin-antitoxin system
MNLSPSRVESLEAVGFAAEHWSTLGDPRSPDAEVLDFCAAHGRWLLTADLDFGAILAANPARRASVVLLRLQDLAPMPAVDLVATTIRRFRSELEEGALLSIDETGGRARLLPLRG